MMITKVELAEQLDALGLYDMLAEGIPEAEAEYIALAEAEIEGEGETSDHLF